MALLAALTASLGLVVPDATLNMVKISSIKGGGGQLPLSMCRWPLWIVSADRVTKLSGAGGAEEEAGWVDPISFEQLWLPEDLPLPSSHLAVSLVIKVRQSGIVPEPKPEPEEPGPRPDPEPASMHASAPAPETESSVIQDGMPRYLLPCLETSITTVSGASATVWHNRGFNLPCFISRGGRASRGEAGARDSP
jgi:hypothetical protein